MAREPDDMVLRVLKNIQKALSDHSERLARIEKGQEEIRDGVIAALGVATHADVRIDGIDKRLETLSARVGRLEKKR